MRTRLRRASLVVVAALAARCAFPDVSMVASSGPTDTPPADEGGNPAGDAFPLADGGLREGDAQSADESSDASADAGPPMDLDAAQGADGPDASAPPADAGRPPSDAESPHDANALPVDARAPVADGAPPNVDAAMPSQDAGGPPDTGHDAGHTKQYPANIDCTSVDMADCNSTIGFADNPDCGDTGTLVECGTTTTHDNSGNGNGNEANKPKQSCVILLQITAVQTCL